MNTLLLTADELSTAGGRTHATVRGDRARHLLDELSVKPGDRVRAGVVDESLGWAEVVSCAEERVEVGLDLREAPPPKLPLTLVVGLPRPKAARRLLVDASAAGVERVVLLGTWRTPKSYWQSPLLQPETIEEHVIRGLGLGGDCIRPQIDLRHRFRPFAEDDLPEILAGRTALAALPDATEPCERASGPVALCIGPERGFTEFERDLLVGIGCRPVSLGARTLRVHAAVHVAIGRLF